jgi:hypothetical protein
MKLCDQSDGKGKLPFKINELQMTRINALRQLVNRREEMKKLA